MRQPEGMAPWCLSPGHAILGHITSHPALYEHPREFKSPNVLSQDVCCLPGPDLGCCRGTSRAQASPKLLNLVAHPRGTAR